MSSDELHEKYAPIMHFSGGERFFPMSVEDFLTYTALYRKEEDKPLKKLHLRSTFLAFMFFEVLFKASYSCNLKNVILHPVRENIMIKFIHLRISDVVGIAGSP